MALHLSDLHSFLAHVHKITAKAWIVCVYQIFGINYQRNTYWVCLDFYLEVCIKITAELLPTYLLPWIAFFRHGMKKLHIFLIRKFIAVFIKTQPCSSLKLVLKVHLLLSSYWNLVLPRNVFLSVYLTKVFCAFLLSPKRNTWPHFILVEFIVLVTFGEKNILTKLILFTPSYFKISC
jgi:hypothetical protein